eukprot:m.655457 g.655457  ORF g.655457 m.655457 type:complete len:56 (-) comp58420_c0_seq3:2-169(-)
MRGRAGVCPPAACMFASARVLYLSEPAPVVWPARPVWAACFVLVRFVRESNERTI